jgi:hypothetical protein
MLFEMCFGFLRGIWLDFEGGELTCSADMKM